MTHPLCSVKTDENRNGSTRKVCEEWHIFTDDTVSFNLEKWNTRRRLSLSMWGDKEVVGEMGKKMNCE